MANKKTAKMLALEELFNKKVNENKKTTRTLDRENERPTKKETPINYTKDTKKSPESSVRGSKGYSREEKAFRENAKKSTAMTSTAPTRTLDRDTTKTKTRTLDNEWERSHDKTYGGTKRARDTIRGAGEQWLGGHISSAGTTLQSAMVDVESLHRAKAEEDNPYYGLRSREEAGKRTDSYMNDLNRKEGVDLKNVERAYDLNKYGGQYSEEYRKLWRLQHDAIRKGDSLIESGGQKIEDAKKGAGKLGSLAVDLGANALQMGGDMALNFIVPSLGMASLMNRAGGTASYEARQLGFNPDQQFLYQQGTALVEGMSEQLFNSVSAFQSAYGRGAFELADKVGLKTASSQIVRNFFKTEAGRSIAIQLSRLGADAFEEGFEEIVAGVAEPALKYMLMKANDPTVTLGGQYDLKEIGYDFLVGALMGGMGGSIDAYHGVKSDLDLANSQAYADGQEYAQKFIDRALVQGREGGAKTDAEILAKQLQEQKSGGKEILPYQTRMLQEKIAESSARNEELFSGKVDTEIKRANSEGRLATTTGTRAEAKNFVSSANTLEARNVERAQRVLGEDATEAGAYAVGSVTTGTATTEDIDTILTEPKLKKAVETITGIDLPSNNAKARTALEDITAMNRIANRNTAVKTAQERQAKNIKASLDNMSEGGQTLFEKNTERAKETVGSLPVYKDIFTRIYLDGTTKGATAEQTYKRAIESLGDSKVKELFTRDFVTQIFNEGRATVVADQAKQTAKSNADKYANRTSGVSFENNDTSLVSGRVAKALEKIAKGSKAEIRVVKSLEAVDENGKPMLDSNGRKLTANGMYKDGIIYISAESKNKLITVARHELTHYIKDVSPERYQELEDFIFERWYNNDAEAMQDAIMKYQRLYNGITPEEAREEIIADSSEAFFTDQSAIEDAIAFSRRLGTTIHRGIKSVLTSFSNALKGDSRNERGYGQFLKEMDILQDAERMWFEALNESARPRKKGKTQTTESKAKNSLSDEDFIVKDGKARWTDKRIRRLMDQEGGMGNYSSAYAVLMNPRDYLKLTLSDDMLDKWNKGANTPDHPETRSLDREKLEKEGQTPYLRIYSKDGTMIQGHEGRHRMRALMDAGVKSVPVVIVDTDTKYSKAPVDSMTLSSQDFGYDPVNNNAKVTIKDLVPIRGDNFEELQKKFGGEADVKFSVSAEEMDAHRKALEEDAEANYGEPYTNDFQESGYVFPNGNMLKMGMYGQRGDDHVMAIQAYDDIGYDTYYSPKAEAQNRFINEGNIRYMPENGWVNFGTEIEPTYDQYAWIRDAVRKSREGITRIEFTNREGETVDYKEYDRWSSSTEIVNDIKRFYSEGEIGGSSYSQFRYSLNENGIDETPDGTVGKLSVTSWEETKKDKKLKALVEAGHDKETASKWIDDINSIASIILGDPDRLDYTADRSYKYLKDNGDYYKKTLDASTLCDKRRLYQGTYNAIQKALPHMPLTEDLVIKIRDMLNKARLESPCGICYVESMRKNLGKYTKEWYDSYARKNEITLADVTTTDGLKNLRKTKPEIANDFIKAMNAKGVNSPKVVQLRTDYREDIMRMTKDTVKYLNQIGGLRFHSFSDFETPHLIDTMQAIMDMSARGLKGMAYTKVPNFVAVFGGTGIKINLSLIVKTDENGNAVYEDYTDENGETKKRLVFDSKEGIDYEEAKKWRDKYPDDVAFILVGKDEQTTIDAINDPRIDYVIPFHRSKWSQENLEKLGLKGYHDFATGHQDNPVLLEEYWDYKKSGKENAEAYLKVCAKKGITPVFEQLLVDNGDGSYSLQPDGSLDNYWKLLIEGKMYNHFTGKGVEQKVVTPTFDMTEAKRVLNEYKGNPNELPVAQDVVDQFVKEYKGGKFSLTADDQTYLDAVNRGDMETAQRMVDEEAKKHGYDIKAYHGTPNEKFTVFNADITGWNGKKFGRGNYFSSERDVAKNYAGKSTKIGEDGTLITTEGGIYDTYLNLGNSYTIDLDEEIAKGKKGIKTYSELSNKIYAETKLSGVEYDSVTIKNIKDGSSTKSDVYIVADPNRIKSADPVTYDDDGNIIPLSERFNESNEDIRYSLTEDSDGNKLSEGQAEFFKDSKARDENGNLYVLYHSSPEQFTVFDSDRLGENTGYDNTALGHFVTSSKRFSDRFGKNQTKLYANIKKLAVFPFKAGIKYSGKELEKITRDWLKMTDPEQLEVYKETKADDPDLTLYDFYMDLFAWDDPYEFSEDYRQILEDNGYDGIEIFEGNENELTEDNSGKNEPVTTYAVFNSNQLKRVDNQNPTENEDIRYSLSEDDQTYLDAVNRGDMETAQKMVDEEAIKNGYNIKAYHGTDAEPFNVFDRDKLKHGRQYGDGFYFSPYEEVAGHYGNEIREYYLKANGMALDELFNRPTAQGYRDFDDREEAHKFFKEKFKQFEENGQGIERFRPEAKRVNGKYRVIYTTIGSFQNNLILVATEPEYIKSADPVTYDDDGNVIPLSERFNESNEDIRWSVSASNEELADRDDTAVFINNSSKANYIGMIFNGKKTEETRARRTLDKFIGKEVMITDGKKVYGTVVFGEPHKYTAEEFHSREAQRKHRVPVGDEYDIKDGGTKWAYPIESYERFDQPRALSSDKNYVGSRQARQVKYSVSEDSDGNKLSEVQAEFFKDSKVRDSKGNLLVMFHGSMEDFTVFQKDKIREIDYDAPFNGFWFTSEEREADPAFKDARFRKKVYLNITNPAPYEVWRQVNKQIEDEWFNRAEGKGVRETARSLNDELRMRLQDMGYDGVHFDGAYNFTEENVKEYNEKGTTTFTSAMGKKYDLRKSEYDDARLYPHNSWNEIIPYGSAEEFLEENSPESPYRNADVWVAFEPNQIKLTTNQNPTENDDIRWSLSEDDTKKSKPQMSSYQKAKQTIKDLRADRDQKIADLKQHRREAVSTLRADRDQKIADLKQHHREVEQAKRERREESEDRTKLLNIARRLSKVKTNEPTRQLIDEFIGELDLVAKSMTGKTLKKLGDLSTWYEEQVQADPYFYDSNIEKKLDRVTKKQIAEPDIEDVRELTTILKGIETSIRNGNKFVESKYKKTMREAGIEAIKDIDQSVGLKNKVIKKFDRFFINGTLSPLRQMHRVTGYNDNDPLYIATQELADGQRNMLSYEMNSWKMFQKYMDDKKFVNSLNGKKAREIILLGQIEGKSTAIKVTPDVAISLYLSSMNEDNLRHMGKGGVEIPDFEKYKKGDLKEAYNASTLVTFSKGQLDMIKSRLTEKEKAFAYTAYEYYNEVAPNAINKVSNILKGYDIARVNNYFPIQVNKDFLDRDFESLKFDGTIEGMGSLKERVVSNTPVVVNGIVDTLTRSIKENSMYVGLAIPVRNFGKLLGVKHMEYHTTEKGKAELGVEYTETTTIFKGSVQKSIRQKWGDPTMKYIEKFMGDLQMSRPKTDDWENALNSWRSNYAGAVLTLNLSVAIKQTASYPTAIAVLGTMPTLRALGKFGTVDLNLIEKYSPLQWHRSRGYSVKELGDIKSGKKGSFVDKVTSLPFFNWIQTMDVLTTRKLWKASEYYVQMHNKSLEKGSEEYYKAVAKIYDRVIEETQPNYTIMQRPQLLRSDSSVVQTLNMFKTQPFQNFNILYDAIGNYIAKAEEYKADKSAENKAKVRQANTDMNNALWSQFLQLATFASMTFVWAFLRGKDDKWKDEEQDKVTLESFLKRLGIEMLSGSSAMLPLGADIYSLATHNTTGDYYSGFQSITDSAINDLFNTGTDLVTLIGDALEYKNAEDKENIDTDAIKRQMEKVVKEWGRFAGVPAQNVKNLFDATYRWVMISANGKYVGEYEALKETFAKDTAKKALLLKAYNFDKEQYKGLRQRMIEDGFEEEKLDEYMWGKVKPSLLEAYNSDKAKYQELRQEMIDNGFSQEKIDNYMWDNRKEALFDAYRNDQQKYEELRNELLSEGYAEDKLDNFIDSQKKENKTEAEQSAYDESINTLESSSLWAEASDEDKDKYSKILEKMSVGIDDSQTESIKKKAIDGLTEEQVILYKLALKKADQPNANGNLGTYTKAEKEEALRLLAEQFDLTEEQKAVLKG